MKAEVSTPQRGLIRALGPLMATAVVVGTVIGSGVFKKPQVVAENVHEFGLAALVWIGVGLLALLGALALAEVAVLYPRAGGNYVFLREGYGRMAGFLWGWVEFWIIRGASLAALATVFTDSFHDILQMLFDPAAVEHILGYWPQRCLTVAVILGLALVNVRGVRWGGGLQLGITLVKVGSLLGILALPFAVAAFTAPGSAPRPNAAYLTDSFWPQSLSQVDLSKIGTALLAVLWAYHGWMNIAPVAEEVKNPQRNIPLALLGGVGIIITLYLGANLAYYLIIPREDMARMKERSQAEIAQAVAEGKAGEVQDQTVAIGFSRRLLGPIGVLVAAAAVMCSVFGALNGNLLVGPRLLYALGEDGLAPRSLGAVHPRYHTPALAILVMAGWASVLVLGVAGVTALWPAPENKSHFDILTDFAMFGAVIFETLAVLTIFVFRWRFPDAPRPYRCWGYPVVPALYVLGPALILGNMFFKQRLEALVGATFIATGAIVYCIITRGGRARLPSLQQKETGPGG
jgi:amino acid transporter